jgi:hypothetical protein
MHQTMQGTLHPVFRSRQLLLASTAKPVTPFGGLVSLIEFFNALKLGEVLGRLMPFAYTSPNAILPEQTLLAFVISIIVGARRLAHTDWLRADRALHAMLGIDRFPGTDTVRNLLKRFTQPMIEAFWRPLWRWLLEQGWTVPAEGWSLDMDSTVFQRSGHQEGAERGYNPSRPGRHTHHPLLAVLAEAPLVLHGWLRSGKAGSARGVVPFLQEALALMPADWKLRTVRADSGFFDQALLGFLEERSLPYIIVARMTRTLKAAAASIKDWTPLDAHYSTASIQLQLHGWSKPRRFVFIRELERADKSAVGRRLIEVPGYTYRIFVTNRDEEPVTLWRDYNQRACVEQRIEELKNDLAADGFCMKQFFATEAAFLSVLFAFNLLSLYQQAVGTRSERHYQRPATLRSSMFLGGAILSNRARQPVLYIAQSWGGAEKHKPLIDKVLEWRKRTSPKLPSTHPPTPNTKLKNAA